MSGEDVDGGDDQRDEEVEGEAENRGARTPFERTRTEKSAGHALEDALRFDLEGYGCLQARGGGVEDAAGEGGGEDCLQGLGHEARHLLDLVSGRRMQGVWRIFFLGTTPNLAPPGQGPRQFSGVNWQVFCRLIPLWEQRV